MPTNFLRLLAALALALGGTHAVGQTWSFAPVADATIFSDGTAAYDATADGAGSSLWTSVLAGGVARRALLRFDVSSIPPGSTVRSVTLTIQQSRARGTHQVAVHRVLEAWGEGPANGGSAGIGAPAGPGDATWSNRIHPQTPWSARGGRFESLPSTSLEVGLLQNFSYTWPSTARLVADVQAWVDRGAPNHGWILIGDETESQNAKRFSSREAPAEVRPRLVVQADPPAAGADRDGEAPLPPWALVILAAALATGIARLR